ncbi:MAG: antitoxin [Synechococcaceae cyanobacterium SM2_3_1]|nr:antitoxin [Synechococcaceae cyanobacterium SM2_3_1]
MSRITIDVTLEQHQQIKAMAAMQGKSIKEFVLERLLPGEENDEQQAWQQLKALLGERIAAAERGAVSKRTITQIYEDMVTTRESQA